jgi:hypothetical protein
VKETVAYCDLDEKDARRPGVAVLSVSIDGTTHVVDVCQVHLTLLSRLPTTAAARAGRGRRAVKRGPAKRAAAAPRAGAAKAPAAADAPRPAKATKASPRKARASRSTAAGRTPGSRRDQQQRVAAAREWARAQGRAIAGKGRLPAGLLEEFDAANQ